MGVQSHTEPTTNVILYIKWKKEGWVGVEQTRATKIKNATCYDRKSHEKAAQSAAVAQTAGVGEGPAAAIVKQIS